MAGMALGDIDLHFAWQARHLATGTFTLRGRHGTWLQRPSLCMAGVAVMSLGWLLVAGLGPLVAATICMAGVALGDSNLHFAWQARYLAISVFTLRGWCVVGDSDLHFAWQVWHLWQCTGSGDMLGSYGRRGCLATATFTLCGSFDRRGCLRGRQGTCRYRLSLCVAGVALMALGWFWWGAWVLWSPRLFAWQAWPLWF